MTPSLFTDQERKEMKRDLIQEINKDTPLHHRLFLVLLGLVAALDPGIVAVTIGIQIAKRCRTSPELFEVFTDLAQL